jgi:hypothetical protein
MMVVLTGAAAPSAALERAVNDWLSLPGSEAIGAVRHEVTIATKRGIGGGSGQSR